MNKILILCLCFFLSACNNDYSKEKQELLSKAKNDVTLLITEHEAELNQLSEFLLQSQQSFIFAEDYAAYLYMKNNISEAEANSGRTSENEARFQLEKSAYSLGIIHVGVQQWGGTNLVTFTISRMATPEYGFNYYLVDLKNGDSDDSAIDFSRCSDSGHRCKVSKTGRWLQVYAFQNHTKQNE